MEPVLTDEQAAEYQRLLHKSDPTDNVCIRMLDQKAPWNPDLYGWLHDVSRRLNQEANAYYGNVANEDACKRNQVLAEKIL